MAKWCFWVCFLGFNVIVVCFWRVWHSSRSVKNACSSQFWGLLWGGFFLLILGLEGLGVFVFLVFVFWFLCCVCSALFALFMFLLLNFVWFWFLFCFCFCFFFFVLVFFVFWATSLGPKPSWLFFLLFVFVGGSGEVAQRATSLGPKPSFFSFFLCYLFFCFPFFVFNRRKIVIPPKKRAFWFIILFFSLFLFSLFGASSFFNFSFLSLSLSLLFFSFFLPLCFSFLYLVLAFSFCFVCFSFKLVFCFCFSACCLGLFWIIILDLFLLCIFLLLLFFFLLLAYFVFFHFWRPIKNISEKHGNSQKCRKTDISARTVSTGVFTNSVFILFCVSFNFACFAESTIKIGVSAKHLKLTFGPS